MKWRLFFPFFAFLIMAAASCGTTSVASIPPLPNTLHMERATHTINTFAPFSQTITRSEDVQTLYNAALALPKASMTGAHSCPAAFGLLYHLRFLQNGTLVQLMDLEPSGCAFLLVSQNDMRAVSEKFMTLFAQVMGIPLSQIMASPLPSKTKPAP